MLTERYPIHQGLALGLDQQGTRQLPAMGSTHPAAQQENYPVQSQLTIFCLFYSKLSIKGIGQQEFYLRFLPQIFKGELFIFLAFIAGVNVYDSLDCSVDYVKSFLMIRQIDV
jgi:hypothetical protein